jgi:hypothetical protein
MLLTACYGHAGTAAAPLPAGDPAGSIPPARQVPDGEASSPDSPTVDRTNLLAVYRGWWAAVQEAFARGEPDYPALDTFGLDPILMNERRQIRVLRAQGIVQRTQLSLMPRVLHQDDTVAEIADCLRGPAGTYRDAATGQPRAPRGYRNDVPTRDSLLVSLQKRGDYWFVVAATDEGVQPC